MATAVVQALKERHEYTVAYMAEVRAVSSDAAAF